MSSVLTETVNIKKLFKWTINKFDGLNESNMKQRNESIGRTIYFDTYVIESPGMTAIDPYDGTKYTATFKLIFRKSSKDFFIVPSVSPSRNNENFFYYYCINDDPKEISCGEKIQWDENIKTVTVYVDIRGVRSFGVPQFKRVNPKNLGNRLTEILKNDSSNKFTIKCGQKSVETYKPILGARSLFFKDMFQSVTQNFLEIADFEVEVVQKMVEFCETDDVKSCNGFEDGLFKIAHKLQINDLMEFAVEKMSENANSSNIHGYLKLAIDYKLKDFEEWCKNFAFRK